MSVKDELVLVIGFNDHADGYAYFAGLKGVEMPDAFTTALVMLTTYDHVCITDPSTYATLGEVDYLNYEPYSITIDVGLYARTGAEPAKL